MKIFVIGIILLGLGFGIGILTAALILKPYEQVADFVLLDRVEARPTFEDLLDAIEQVESGGGSGAVGDNGRAVGAYQIHKIYVDDVNRIKKLGQREEPYWYGDRMVGYFSYKDRRDRDKSRIMVSIYLTHYGGTFEEMARKHNGGAQGHKKPETLKYWLKVKAAMNGRKWSGN